MKYAVYARLREKADVKPEAVFDDILPAVKAALILIEHGHAIVSVIDLETGKIHLGWDKP